MVNNAIKIINKVFNDFMLGTLPLIWSYIIPYDIMIGEYFGRIQFIFLVPN